MGPAAKFQKTPKVTAYRSDSSAGSGEGQQRVGNAATRWLCWQSPANASLVAVSLLTGRNTGRMGNPTKIAKLFRDFIRLKTFGRSFHLSKQEITGPGQ